MFDFESPGTGKYTFEPVTTFQIIDDDAKPNAFKVSATSVEVNVMDDVAKRELKMLDKRATVSCSSSSQSSFISSRYPSLYLSFNGAENCVVATQLL